MKTIGLDHREALRVAYRIAGESPDPSTQNGGFLMRERSLIAGTEGRNEFPRGVLGMPERWERPLKYSIVEHAERNVIYSAARHGISTWGATIVVAWAACADCARAIIQAGIAELVTHHAGESHWDESIQIGMTMLDEAGVHVSRVTGLLGDCGPVLRNGELMHP